MVEVSGSEGGIRGRLLLEECRGVERVRIPEEKKRKTLGGIGEETTKDNC